jgi:hypothetical protein
LRAAGGNTRYGFPLDEADAMQPNTLTMLTALFFVVVIGTAGFVISLLNYFRDRPKVIAFLGWDYVVTSDPDLKRRGAW